MLGEIKTLHPAFKMIVDQILDAMRAKGWDAVIGSGMRTLKQQAALYAQGRESLTKVNELRREAEMVPISAAENGIVTHAKAGESNHNLTTALVPYTQSTFVIANGYAVDIVSRAHGWHPPKGFFHDLGTLAKKHGCQWGGDWKGPKYDPSHVQIKLSDSAPRDSFTV